MCVAICVRVLRGVVRKSLRARLVCEGITVHYRCWWMVQRVVPEVIRDAKVYRISQDRVVGLDLFRRVYNCTTLRFY